jgi:hypothetical protein
MVSQGGRVFEGRCGEEREIEIDRRLPVVMVAHCLDMRCDLEVRQRVGTSGQEVCPPEGPKSPV